MKMHRAIASLFAGLLLCGTALAAPPNALVPQLQQRLGLTEPQVRGALGAMLVYA